MIGEECTHAEQPCDVEEVARVTHWDGGVDRVDESRESWSHGDSYCDDGAPVLYGMVSAVDDMRKGKGRVQSRQCNGSAREGRTSQGRRRGTCARASTARGQLG